VVPEFGEELRETHTSVNGKTEKQTDMESIPGSMATDMKGNSSNVSNMDKEYKNSLMAMSTEELMKMVSLTVMASTSGVTEASTKVTLKMDSETGKEPGRNQATQVQTTMKENLLIRRNKVMEFSFGQMVVNT